MDPETKGISQRESDLRENLAEESGSPGVTESGVVGWWMTTNRGGVELDSGHRRLLTSIQ